MPLHWACYSKSEYALSFILALKPNLEIPDKISFTPLHLAIRSVDELKSKRPVRSLLLKGSDRSAKSNEGQGCQEQIRDGLPEKMKQLKYVECYMMKTPMVRLKQNHKTQVLFLVLFVMLAFAQILFIVPSKAS
jgi:hypothetical protein